MLWKSDNPTQYNLCLNGAKLVTRLTCHPEVWILILSFLFFQTITLDNIFHHGKSTILIDWINRELLIWNRIFQWTTLLATFLFQLDGIRKRPSYYLGSHTHTHRDTETQDIRWPLHWFQKEFALETRQHPLETTKLKICSHPITTFQLLMT